MYTELFKTLTNIPVFEYTGTQCVWNALPPPVCMAYLATPSIKFWLSCWADLEVPSQNTLNASFIYLFFPSIFVCTGVSYFCRCSVLIIERKKGDIKVLIWVVVGGTKNWGIILRVNMCNLVTVNG